MSDDRAKKNKADRDKGIRRLEKRFKTQNITKDTINSRGYNKFLSIEGDATVKIDYSKIEHDAKFEVYHRLFNRIEAHICICFTAYTIMLELERLLKASGTDITLQRTMFLVEKIYRIYYFNPFSRKRKSVIPKSENYSEVMELLGIIDAVCQPPEK